MSEDYKYAHSRWLADLPTPVRRRRRRHGWVTAAILAVPVLAAIALRVFAMPPLNHDYSPQSQLPPVSAKPGDTFVDSDRLTYRFAVPEDFSADPQTFYDDQVLVLPDSWVPAHLEVSIRKPWKDEKHSTDGISDAQLPHRFDNWVADVPDTPKVMHLKHHLRALWAQHSNNGALRTIAVLVFHGKEIVEIKAQLYNSADDPVVPKTAKTAVHSILSTLEFKKP